MPHHATEAGLQSRLTVMTDGVDLTAHGRAIVDANLYMVLGTADQAGRPWVTPVYFAPTTYRELLWVSRPEAKHSENLQARAEVGIVIFDSSVPISTGQAVYMSATAGEVPPDEREQAVDVFSRRGISHGGSAWTSEDVVAPAPHRLYRAVAIEQYVLDEHDNRVPVSL
jgi:nitroimidazol reductase NimA-like FMN-containing flavoprotein (pyridoxamine 5'-phosphate oxidase superfamily)